MRITLMIPYCQNVITDVSESTVRTDDCCDALMEI